MDEYPDYVFGASQPQLFDWIKNDYPALYDKIRKRVKEGRFEVQGAMWVEADTNITGGESLIRQLYYGKKFFKDEFGIDVKSLWLPDVFGYSGALPQLLAKSGIPYFMTQKLSWNEHNRFPHQTFWWEGIDGSRVLTHMLPEETYNGPATPSAIYKVEHNYIDSCVTDKALMLFGIGDGGGGPGREHLERLKRARNLSGLSPVVQEPSAAFFDKLQEDSHRFKQWRGELYLEKHQGTYTTQAKNKWYNRQMEIGLRELEFAMVLSGVPYADYQQHLETIWKEVLLYQFHDIIPGSSVHRVYEESLARYEDLLNQVTELRVQFYEKITRNMHGHVVFNSLSWERRQWLTIEGQDMLVTVPALGYATIERTHAAIYDGLAASDDTIENQCLRVTFDEQGHVVSVFHKGLNRETLSGPGNVLAVYQDNMESDAWDIRMTYRDVQPETFTLVEQRAYVQGAKAIMEQRYRYGNSTISQNVVLMADSGYVDFQTRADWHEKRKMLRTSFDVNVYAPSASYGIQFGRIERPTHENTLWDVARFETCAHKWVDLSQGDFGVSLLNDCKYGHRLAGNVLDLNLLRSPHYPDATADMGEHEFRYALYPHKGDVYQSEVVRQAYEYNMPLICLPGQGQGNTAASLMQVQGNAVIETVKVSEDRKGVLVRLYEPYGQRARVALIPSASLKQAYFCNLLEEQGAAAELADNTVPLVFKPFEIITLKLIF